MTDYDPNAPEDNWYVQYCGGEYVIQKDTTRARTAPKWFVLRVNDARVSVRHYSRPSGAFMALHGGAMHWSEQ